MTSLSSYQPFLIGKFTTGQFQYLQPWQRAEDAFDPLDNAYVYRGSIYKRNGMTTAGHTGRLRYCNNQIIAPGDGGSIYSGTLSDFPIEAGSMTVTALTSAGATPEVFTDDGLGVLTGSIAGTGTINYTTGAWTLDFTPNTVAANVPIVAHYIYTPTLNTTPIVHPIMGINNFHNETNNSEVLVVEDTRRAAFYNTTTRVFDPICCMDQTLFLVLNNAVVTTGAINTGFTNIAPYSVEVTDGTATIEDVPGVYPLGTFTTLGNFTGGTINYATGVITINFTAYGPTFPVTISVSADLQGDYFTGDNTNFFNYTNWQPGNGTPNLLYLTNNADPVTTFDGTCLSRIPYSITLAHYNAFVNDIARTLDVKVYKDRLIFIRPTLVEGGFTEPQTIRWSLNLVPRNFIADISNNGGFLEAPTSDWAQASEFLRDILVCFFQDSTWIFRSTGSRDAPFRFDQVNNSRSCNAPYGSIAYDLNCTAMGARGLIYCDGVNVDRYDINVIDVFNDIDHTNFIQCIAERYDELNQGWMIYPSDSRTDAETFSDRAIVYNYLESSWSTYTQSLSFIGISKTFSDIKWSDFAPGSGEWVEGFTWADSDFTWRSGLLQDLVPALYGGDQNGIVYLLDSGETDNGAHIESTITSKRWNPFVGTGERVRFGYIDIYYQVNAEVVLVIDFFVNNSADAVLTKNLTLDGPGDEDFAWKRVHINLQGEFLRLSISTPILNADTEDEILNDGQYQISGMILWAQPCGRLVPGGFA